MTTSTDPIEILQARYAESIGVLPGVPKRFPTSPGDGESLHVEFVDGGYVLILTGDGVERQRRSSPDVEQVMYWIMSYMAFERHVATLMRD